jgi:hypothetical protein
VEEKKVEQERRRNPHPCPPPEYQGRGKREYWERGQEGGF